MKRNRSLQTAIRFFPASPYLSHCKLNCSKTALPGLIHHSLINFHRSYENSHVVSLLLHTQAHPQRDTQMKNKKIFDFLPLFFFYYCSETFQIILCVHGFHRNFNLFGHFFFFFFFFLLFHLFGVLFVWYATK